MARNCTKNNRCHLTTKGKGGGLQSGISAALSPDFTQLPPDHRTHSFLYPSQLPGPRTACMAAISSTQRVSNTQASLSYLVPIYSWVKRAHVRVKALFRGAMPWQITTRPHPAFCKRLTTATHFWSTQLRSTLLDIAMYSFLSSDYIHAITDCHS